MLCKFLYFLCQYSDSQWPLAFGKVAPELLSEMCLRKHSCYLELQLETLKLIISPHTLEPGAGLSSL